MRRVRAKSRPTIQFNESSGKVCGPVCRANAIIDRERDRALLRGWKAV